MSGNDSLGPVKTTPSTVNDFEYAYHAVQVWMIHHKLSQSIPNPLVFEIIEYLGNYSNAQKWPHAKAFEKLMSGHSSESAPPLGVVPVESMDRGATNDVVDEVCSSVWKEERADCAKGRTGYRI